MNDIPVAPADGASHSRKPSSGLAAASGSRPPAHSSTGGSPAVEPPRRSFIMEALAGIIGGLVGLVPVAAGVMVYLDPLRRKKPKASAVPITTLDKLPDSSAGDVLLGVYKINANRQDAWNLYPNEPIGSVYLVCPKGSKDVVALNATCPHLGCFVDVNQSPAGYSFLCPCHTSAFNGDGERIMPCVSPRDMDTLDVVQSKPKADGTIDISVVFQNFQPGLTEKKPKT